MGKGSSSRRGAWEPWLASIGCHVYLQVGDEGGGRHFRSGRAVHTGGAGYRGLVLSGPGWAGSQESSLAAARPHQRSHEEHVWLPGVDELKSGVY